MVLCTANNLTQENVPSPTGSSASQVHNALVHQSTGLKPTALFKLELDAKSKSSTRTASPAAQNEWEAPGTTRLEEDDLVAMDDDDDGGGSVGSGELDLQSDEDDDSTPAPPDLPCVLPKRRWVGFRNAIDRNPHAMRTQQDAAPEFPGPGAVHFTNAVFERVPMTESTLLNNICQHQLALIEKNRDSVLLALPANPSRQHAKKYPNFPSDLANAIKSFGYGDDNVMVVQTKPAGPVGRNKLSPPIVYIIPNASERARAFLRWYQTIAVNENLAVSLYHLDDCERSWVVATLGGTGLRPDTDAMVKTLKDAATALKKLTAFQKLVHRIFGLRGITGDGATHVRMALSTMSILHVNRRDPKTGDVRPVWVVMCEPISSDLEDHKLWIGYFKKLEYAYGWEPLEHVSISVHCDFCMAVTHYHYECPRANAPDWLGPRAETGEEYSAKVRERSEPKRPLPRKNGKQAAPRVSSFQMVGKAGKHK